jgi:hypothetical protein
MRNQCRSRSTRIVWSGPTLFASLLEITLMNPTVNSVDPDQPVHSCSLIWTYTVRFFARNNLMNLTANSVDPDQTARMRRLIWPDPHWSPMGNQISYIRISVIIYQDIRYHISGYPLSYIRISASIYQDIRYHISGYLSYPFKQRLNNVQTGDFQIN